MSDGRVVSGTRPPDGRAIRPLPGLTLGTIAVLMLVLLARALLLDVRQVASDSMEPTVPTGSTVVIGRHLPPVRGSLVEVTVGTETLLKRVVATAGQTVAIQDAILVVDGVEQSEAYVDYETMDGVYLGAVTVPPASVFVLGDNRGASIDSRDFGPVPLDQVHGIVIARLPF